jgi:hypothetical protein
MSHKRAFLKHIMTPQAEQEISTSGLKAGDKLAVRTAIAALDLLKNAATDLGCPIEQLNETTLIQWLKENYCQS